MNPRPTFSDRYSLPLEQRHILRRGIPRLLDLLLFSAPRGDVEFLTPPQQNEFVVVDIEQKEKAWFDGSGLTSDQITGLVSEFFGATAYRVSSRVWFV